MKKSLLTILCLLCSLATGSYATQSDNHGIHAVPTPGPVTIDGDLSDWDLSGQTLMCYDIENLRDTHSAEVAMMYDATNLYVSLHFKDPTPLSNHHDPHYQGDKGWAADAVQLRIRTDRIAHVTAWDFIDKNEPTIQITYGTDQKTLAGPSIQLFQTSGWKLDKGAEMAFKKDADGKGYVQEMKLPWSLLAENKHYAAGDSFNCGVELFWGSADWPDMRYADNLMPGKTSREFFWTSPQNWGPVWLEPKGHLNLPTPAWLVKAENPIAAIQGPVPISYTLPHDARVTIAIDDPAGNRVRNLIPALPRLKGKNVDYWDGLDDAGKPVPPGKYTYTAIYHDPLHLNYALSFANPGNPSWGTPDGRGQYYGDHSAPHAVATAGNYVALACPIGEAGQPLIGCDLNGQRLWGQANRIFASDQITSLATDGKTVWVASDGSKSTIYRDDIATGLYSPWNQTATDADGHTFKVLDLLVSPTMGIKQADGQMTHNLTAIAQSNGILAVCLALDNQVKLLDSATGAVKSTFSIPSPQSVAIDSDGTLIVLSEGKLLRVDASGHTTPFTAKSYPDAYGVAVDPQRNVYLSVRGDDQNVKVFSQNGELIRQIGKLGGRPANGPYDADAMLNPAQIAIDSEGRLWVTEENKNPKRTSVWNASTGALVKDLAGTTSYAGAGSLDPYDPTLGFSDDTVYKIDWASGAYHPIYSLSQRDPATDLFPPSVHNLTSRIVKNDHGTYVYTTGAAATSTTVTCTLYDGKNWRSAAAVGMVPMRIGKNQSGYDNPIFTGHAGQLFTWADKNGDGLVQSDEIAFSSPQYNGQALKFQSLYWGQLPASDGTIIYPFKTGKALIKLPITGYTSVGAPIYDAANPKVIPVDSVLGSGNGEGQIIGGEDGRVYVNEDPITVFDKEGHIIGTYPSHFTSVHGSHDARAAKPGYIIGPSSFLGTADMGGSGGEVFDLNGNLGENYIFTQDGLFVQSLFRDGRAGFSTPNQAVRGMSMDETTGGGESFGGNFVRTPDGNVYLTIGGTDAKVMEVSGLNTIQRFGGDITYTPAEYVKAQQIDVANAAQTVEPKVFTIARTTTPIAIDGNSQNWPELLDTTKPLMEIEDSPQTRYGRVAARYDDQNLYLAYRVYASANHMRNMGQDKKMLFKTGDNVDVMLGPDPQNGLTGDLRLLMTVQGDQPIAVLNEKLDPRADASQKYIFAAPWHQISFDRVAVVPNVKIAQSPMQGGYFVEAAIPWSVLGIQPRSGLHLKGDVGILFADNGGTITVSRQYWSNKSTGLVNDVPGEADLTPGLWGEFVLE